MIGAKFKRLFADSRGDGLRAQLLRGGAGVGVLKVLSLPLMFLATILLARGLGPEGFGRYAFVIALVTILSIPLAPALMQLVTRETARTDNIQKDGGIHALLRWANRQVWIGSLLVILVVAGLASWMASWRVDDRWTLLLVSLVALPFLGLNAVRAGILVGLRRVVLGQFPDLFIRPLALLIIAGGLLLFGNLNAVTAIGAFALSAASAFLVGTIFLRRIFPLNTENSQPTDPDLTRQWARAWMPFTLLVAASTLNAQIGILMLGWLSSNDQVAAMQVADRGAMLVVLSLTVVNLVIGPHITQVHRSGDRARLQQLSRHSARWALVVALPLALPLVFFGKQILEVVFGAEYAAIAAIPLGILAIAQLANVAFGSVGRLLVMSGYEIQSLFGQVFALAVVLLSGLVLIPPFGAVGAATAVALGIVVWNIVLAVKVFRILGIRPGVA